jgi:two-component system, sensor histidine kinase and response regulator
MQNDSTSTTRSDYQDRALVLLREHRTKVYKQTDRLFVFLMIVQWLAGVAASLWLSPRAWSGLSSSVHPHVWAALFLGTGTMILPIGLAIFKSGETVTRHVVAIGQMLSSALLIHLTGGRIETHFHVFGSLAFLAFYRDWKVLISATAVVAADHIVRGIYLPKSVFGVLTAGYWRWLEHAGWVIFEDIILVKSCLRGVQEMWGIALRQANLQTIGEGFEQKVRELEIANSQAEAATRARDAFLASMSHEIRTPMNGIIGMNALLLQSPLSNGQREYALVVDQSSRALLTILNDILDFSKIEAGKMSIEPVPFDFTVVVQEIVDLFAPQSSEKGIDLFLRYAPNTPHAVIGDSGRIRQVLLNLVGNAIKFTDKGHVFVNVSCLETRDTDALLEISVADTGIGIPEERLHTIFHGFTQADTSTTRRFGGTGLGLAISKQLLNLMGGTMNVQSRLGQGSEFCFSLRLPLDSLAPPHRVFYAELKSTRILILTEDAITCHILSEQLTTFKIRHSCVKSPGHAIQVMREAADMGDPFLTMVVDVGKSAGWAEKIARLIRSDFQLKATDLMALSTFGRHGDAPTFEKVGFSAYLTHPLLTSTFMETLIAMSRAVQSGTKPSSIITRHTLVDLRKQQPEPQAGELKTTLRILVAEDNLVNQKLILHLIERWGFQADLARDGRQCLQLWSKSRYDAILMDCEMPQMDGREASREIRLAEERDRLPRTPIIALTASAMIEDQKKCFEAGMDGFVSKPIRLEELRRILLQFASPAPDNDIRAASRIADTARGRTEAGMLT